MLRLYCKLAKHGRWQAAAAVSTKKSTKIVICIVFSSVALRYRSKNSFISTVKLFLNYTSELHTTAVLSAITTTTTIAALTLEKSRRKEKCKRKRQRDRAEKGVHHRGKFTNILNLAEDVFVWCLIFQQKNCM